MRDEEPTISLTPLGPDRWRLVTPEHRRATLDDAAVLDGQLADGLPWTPALRRRVAVVLAEAGARLAAQRLLRVRSRSSAELRQRLEARYPKPAVEKVLAALVRSGAIDDARLAQDLAERLGRQRPHAREAVRDRLERAIVPDEALRAALDAHAPAEQEQARADRAAAEQHARLSALGLAPAVVRRRLLAALARRGFDAETARCAVERVLGPEPEPELDQEPDLDEPTTEAEPSDLGDPG
ncbi:MAG: hypothetical protein KatS3mg103_0061 [Phycisphaerales bacterium]|nr:MAG: hypothetical protein KatS3mg103_0061 [Phycisphaerales bacterium]